MSYRDQNPGYPPQSNSQYPPPPGEEDERARYYHQRQRSSSGQVTLPSIVSHEPPYAPQPQGYAQDQRNYQSEHQYRQPPTPSFQQDYNRSGAQAVPFNQSAPRQRTAIACRYCRRRKIRCSGFDQNPEGRCVNCQRFQQECIFTPVSSQAQAFVPAHAVYPAMRNMGIGPDGRPRPMYPQGAPLFGAHGQPLPAAPQVQGHHYDYPVPSPTGSYGSYPGDDRNSQPPPDMSRKRLQHDSHPSILPPLPGHPARRGHMDDDYRLPPVTPTGVPVGVASYSPGSSHSSHSNLQPHKPNLSYMSRTPPPRNSPGDGRVDPMSLGNIMERRPESEIDRSMLGRLDRKA